jgi:hypothetical protein
MLYIAFVLFWAVILTPLAISHLRDRGPEKSIKTFHEEHARFADRELSAEPVNRLDPGYARPIGRGTVFADDNYDRGYAPSHEFEHFAGTATGREYSAHRSSWRRRRMITFTLGGLSIVSWIAAAFMGGVAVIAGAVLLIADLSYIGLYFVAVYFGFMGYQNSYYEDAAPPVINMAEHREIRYSQDSYNYYEPEEYVDEYRRDALG